MSQDTYESLALYVRDGEDYRTATPDELMVALKRMLSYRFRRGSHLQSPETVRAYLQVHLSQLGHEVFCMLALDAHHRLIAHLDLFRGTIDGATVHPREVVKEALQLNASAVIFVHNHPLCCVTGVNTRSRVTRSVVRKGRCAEQGR